MRQRRNARGKPCSALRCLGGALLSLLAGCQPNGPDTPYEIYLGKLGTALPVAHLSRQTSSVPTLPGAERLRLDISPDNDTKIDFLDLSGCALQSTLIKQNSSLGRHAKPSQRLLLELEYLRLAPPCISRLRREKNTAVADTLEQTWHLGRQQLPARIFNATLGSEEYGAFWRATPAAGAYPRGRPGEALSALDRINDYVQRWLTGDYRAQNRDFELLLTEVAQGEGGALQQELARQGDWLATANLMLEGGLARNPLCSAGKRAPATVDRLANTRRYFDTDLQPRISRTTRRYRAVLSSIDRLEAQLTAALPPRYRRWADERNQRFAALERAPSGHLEQLSRARQSCTSH